MLDAREANYQKLRVRQGLNPGSPFERQPPTTWRNSNALAPMVINVVDPRETVRSEEIALLLTDEGPEDFDLTGKPGRTRKGVGVLPHAKLR